MVKAEAIEWIDNVMVYARADRLVRIAVGSFLVVIISGIVGISWDVVHIPVYIFGVEIPWMGRAAHIPMAMVGIILWFWACTLLTGWVIVKGVHGNLEVE